MPRWVGLCLMAFAWIVWTKISDGDKTEWIRAAAEETHDGCLGLIEETIAELERRSAQVPGSSRFERVGHSITTKGGRQITFQCWPDTVDPRK